MNTTSWNRLVKNYVRTMVFSFFKGARFSTFFDIPGEGCLSTIEAHRLRVIYKRSTILWAERSKVIGASISDQLKTLGFKNTIPCVGDVSMLLPDVPIDFANLDLMGQVTEGLMVYIRDKIRFSEGSGFSLNVHHHGTRVKSNFLTAADQYFGDKPFVAECFNGKTIKLKPHQFPGVIDNTECIRYTDKCVNTIYGLLSKVALMEYTFKLESIIIYGESHQENNMVTFVISNITRKPNKRSVSSYRAQSTKILSAISKLM